ncbi:MAG: N-formylglutamate amidohydrolase [Oceanospirillaceae bacterium]|nr:N-formylglutamate amidohydrolase [Oceanospirillaceae bacterium]
MLDINNQSIANIINAQGDSRFVIICEHASHFIPSEYQNLGLNQTQILSHIGWDIGAQALSEQLSKLLNAPLIVQTHSRLLYDCNRPPSAASAVPEQSETTIIPGNTNLTPAQKQARADSFYYPFHQSVSDFLDHRQSKTNSIIVTIHSFNAIYNGVERDVDIGFIEDLDPSWSKALTLATEQIPGIKGAQNLPYSAFDGVTHTLQMHGTNRSLANVMIEVKNNLIDSAPGQLHFALLLDKLLRENLN